jgi:hypothetical protein
MLDSKLEIKRLGYKSALTSYICAIEMETVCVKLQGHDQSTPPHHEELVQNIEPRGESTPAPSAHTVEVDIDDEYTHTLRQVYCVLHQTRLPHARRSLDEYHGASSRWFYSSAPHHRVVTVLIHKRAQCAQHQLYLK